MAHDFILQTFIVFVFLNENAILRQFSLSYMLLPASYMRMALNSLHVDAATPPRARVTRASARAAPPA